MAKTRKSVTVTLKITAPVGMPARAIRREVLTRINDMTGHFDGFDFNLPSSAEGDDGCIRIRAAIGKRES
jgi:hypothetical protein